MIPIKQGQLLHVTVDDDLKIGLRYIADADSEGKYRAIMHEENIDCMEADRLALEEKADYTRSEDTELFHKHMTVLRSPKQAATQNAYIDCFIAELNGEPCEKPSAMFKIFDKAKLYEIIMDNHNELTGLSGEEIKN